MLFGPVYFTCPTWYSGTDWNAPLDVLSYDVSIANCY